MMGKLGSYIIIIIHEFGPVPRAPSLPAFTLAPLIASTHCMEKEWTQTMDLLLQLILSLPLH